MQTVGEQRESADDTADRTAVLNDHPAVMLPDASFLYYGSFEKVGFDLVITNADGETFTVEDYFSFIPPPNLMLPNGAGLSPEMVAAKLHLPFEDVMFAGPANSANALEEIGTVTLLLGEVTVKRRAADGSIEEVRLSRGDTLYEGDEITTGDRAFVKARMLDGTRFHLGKNANATLTDFEYSESARQGNFEAFVQRGGFHYKSGKIGKMFEGLGKNHATISTPSALIGIRGSELDGHVDENGNTLIRHTSGELMVMDINGLSETLLTDPGNTSFVTINGANTRFESPTAEQEAIFEVVLPPADTPEELIEVDEESPAEEEAPQEQETAERPPAEEQADSEGESAEAVDAEETEDESSEDTDEETEEDPEEDVPEEDSLEEDSGEEESREEENPDQETPEEGSTDEGSTDERSAEESSVDETAENLPEETPEEGSDEAVAEDATEESVEEVEERVAADDGDQPDSDPDPSGDETASDVEGSAEETRVATEQGSADEDSGSQSALESQGSDEENLPGQVSSDGSDSTESADNQRLAGQDSQGNDEQQNEDPVSLQNFDATIEGLTGVTIRESSFVETGADIVAAENEVVAGSLDPTGANSNNNDDQEVAGSDLEILDVPTADESDPDTRLEERNNDPEVVQEELLPDNPPVARNDLLEVREAGAREVTNLLLSNDADGDEGQDPTLAQISGSGSLGGRIEFNGDRAVYIPSEEALENLRGEETATETFSYRIVSGDLTDTATLTVRLVGSNLAPVAEDDEAETIEDTSIAINVLANDGDPDGDTLTVVGVNDAEAFGTVTIAGDGKGLIYTPPDGLGAGEVGEDVFTYRVSDGQYTDTASITVTVTGRNDPPVINTEGEPFEVKAGGGATTIPLDVIFADSDLSDELEVVAVDTSNTKGLVTIGSIIYDDNGFFDFLKPGETATDSFGVTAQDQNGAQGSGVYTVVINGVNDAPVAGDDSYVGVSGETVSGNVLSNDSDIDDDEIAVLVNQTEGPQFGDLTLLPNGNFLYTPGSDFEGEDSFQYTVSDGELQDTAVVRISVDLTNDAPLTAPDFFTVSVEGSVIGNVLDNDVDPEGQSLSTKLGQEPQFGTVNLSVGGIFEYTPNDDTQGQTDSFSYIAIDAVGRETEEIVTINIVADNLPPDLVNPIPDATVPFGETSSIDLSSFFSDPEDGPLDFAFSTSAGTAAFSLTGSVLSVTPPASAEGETVTVDVAASDGESITTDQFVLTVGPQNQAPIVANPVSDQNVVVGVNLNQNVSSVFSDPDATDTLTFSLQTNAPFLTLSGAVLFGTPSGAQTGTYTIQLTATDPAGATATDTFTLTVSAPPANNPSTPVSGDQVTGTTTNTLSSTFVAADSEGLPATGIYSIASSGTFGTAFIDADTGAWSYIVDTPPYTGTDVFMVNVTDATGDVTTLPINILIRPVDVPGSLSGATTDTTTENVPVTNALSLVDSQGIAATNPYSISTTPTNGNVTIDSAGVWTYTPDNGYTGGDSFVVTALDGFNYPNTQLINVTVNPLPAPNNPATGSVDITGSTEFGNTLTAVPTGVSDADGLSGVVYFYEWFVDGVSQGAPSTTSNTFTTTISDVGKAVTVDVTFTDDLGFGEFLSNTVFISPQDPNVSGPQSYTFVPSFVDDVLGSNGNDNITAINAAESGDIVDLDDGIDTLTLADGVNNTLEIEGVETLLGGNLADSITISGFLNTLDGILSNRTAGDEVESQAYIQLFNETVNLGTGVYDFVNESNGTLQITSTGAHTVNLQEFSSNYGTVILDGSGTSTLSVQSGNFIQFSSGIFLVQGLGNHEFDGQFYNGGNLQINANFSILPGGQLDLTSGGNFFIDNAATLTFNNSSLYTDSTTSLNGSQSETIQFINNSTLHTDNTYQHYDNNPTLDFDGTTLIDGDFLLGVNASLTFFGDTANATLTNQGNLVVKTPGPSTINTLINNASGSVQLASDATDTSSVLIVTSSLTNDGVIELDNTDNTINLTSTLTVGGVLTNNAGGVIISRDDDQMLNPGERHTIDATVVNDGTIRVFADLEITKTSGDHDINGTIELREDYLLAFGGELVFVNANTVDFGINSLIDGHGTITSNVAINHQGSIEPDENGSQGLITFNGDLDLSGNSAVELTVFGGGAYDQLVVTGQLDAGNANLKIDFEDSTSFTSGGTIDNVIDFGTLINDFDPVIQHNLGAGYSVTLVNDGGAHYDLNIVASFDTVSNNVTPFNWTSGADWTAGVPTAIDNALIDGHMVTHASAGTSQANSLTIANSGALDIDNGTLVVTDQSRVDFSSGLSINPAPGGVLQLESNLVVEGTLALNGGTITSTTTFGVIDVIGNMTVTLDNTPTLEVQVVNNGNLTISGATGSVSGNQHIYNEGILKLEGNGNIDLPIDNFSGGIIEVGSTSSTIMVTHSQNVDNFADGVYRLDTPGSGAQGTSVELNNGAFNNQGLLQIMDSGASGGARFFDMNGYTFSNNGGVIDVQADVTLDIEGGSLNNQNGDIFVATSMNLNIDGGTGGNIDWDGGSSFSGDGNINFLNTVTLTLMSDTVFNSNNFFDTSGGDLTITGAHQLFIDGGTTLGLNDDDVISTSSLDINGNLDLNGHNISISAPVTNFGNVNAIGAPTFGTKTFTGGFTNYGNIILDVAAGETNTFWVTTTLDNEHTGFIQSQDSGGATNENVLRAELENKGTLQVDYNLILDQTGVVTHENKGDIVLANGATLTVGVNDTLENVYDDMNGDFGVISGNGLLDVSGTGVALHNDGIIRPGGEFSTDTLTLQGNASTQFGHGSVIDIELDLGSDQLVLNGFSPELNGRLRLSPLSTVTPGSSYTVISAASGFVGLFATIEGTDLWASDSVVLDITNTGTDLMVDAVTPDIVGSTGADGTGTFVPFVTAGADVIHGDDGDDVIAGASTGDTVFGGEGDDIIITDTGIKRVDGGGGIDVLQLTNSTVNFVGLDGYRVEFIEALGLEGNGAQTVTLDATAIRNIVDEENDLTFSEGSIVVFGDDSDHLVLLGDYDPMGTDFFDIRNPGTFEEFIWLEQDSTSTGTTSVYFGDQISAEVQRLDGSKDIYGGAGDDDIQSGGDIVPTANDDVIDGRDGNDHIDGGLGDDVLSGGHGNDTIVYDTADTGAIDGGEGFDTLLDTTPGATINLNGVTNLMNFERVDMKDGDGSDSLSLDVAGLGNIIGDNSLESILPDGQLKFVVDGDAGDQFNLSGVSVHSTDVATLAAAGWVTNGVEADYLGQGSGNHYLKLTNGGIDVFVHEDLANVV